MRKVRKGNGGEQGFGQGANQMPNQAPNQAPNLTPNQAPNLTPNQAPSFAPRGERGGYFGGQGFEGMPNGMQNMQRYGEGYGEGAGGAETNNAYTSFTDGVANMQDEGAVEKLEHWENDAPVKKVKDKKGVSKVWRVLSLLLILVVAGLSAYTVYQNKQYVLLQQEKSDVEAELGKANTQINSMKKWLKVGTVTKDATYLIKGDEGARPDGWKMYGSEGLDSFRIAFQDEPTCRDYMGQYGVDMVGCDDNGTDRIRGVAVYHNQLSDGKLSEDIAKKLVSAGGNITVKDIKPYKDGDITGYLLNVVENNSVDIAFPAGKNVVVVSDNTGKTQQIARTFSYWVGGSKSGVKGDESVNQ